MNKLALITGGYQNIGLAIAESFLKKDIPVHLVARSKDKLILAQDELMEKYGKPVNISAVDVTKPGSMEAVIDSIVVPGTELYMINNAGAFKLISPDMPYDEVNKLFSNVMELNFSAPARIANYLVDKFKNLPNSNLHLVNVSSQSAIRPELGGNRAYGTAKDALQGFTHRLENEYSSFSNINIYSILPGVVATPDVISMWKEDPSRFGEPTSLDSVSDLVIDMVNNNTPTNHAYIGNVQNDIPSFIPDNMKGIIRAFFKDHHRLDEMQFVEVDPTYRFKD